jgi:hypothetical protein
MKAGIMWPMRNTGIPFVKMKARNELFLKKCFNVTEGIKM